MEDLKKILVFIGMVFLLLFSFTMLGKSQEDVLVNYNPHQEIRPTNRYDRVEFFDTTLEIMMTKPVTKPYVMITDSEEPNDSDEPTYRVIDYGTYHEIDSLKCIRYKQMQWKLYYLDKLKEKSCE